MTLKRIVLGGATALLVASNAFASPFCVQLTGMPLQCLYADPGSCQKEADRVGGRCAANPAEFLTPAGGSAFCVVESGNVVSCLYPDRASCIAESTRKNGACIAAAPTAAPPSAVDPFEIKRPY